MVKYSIQLVSIVFLLVSCQKVEKIEKAAGSLTAKLIVNCLAEEGEQMVFSVSKSLSALDNASLKILKTATIKLYKNGVFKETIKYNSLFQTYYSDSVVANAGSSYRIEVSAPGLASVSSEFIMPEAIVTTRTSIKIDGKKYGSGFSSAYFSKGSLKVSFQDKPGIGDRYLIRMRQVWSDSSQPGKGFDYGQEWECDYPGMETVYSYDGASDSRQNYFLTDDLNDGKEINLEFRTTYEQNIFKSYNNDSVVAYVLTVSKLSKDYFSHLYTLKLSQQNDGDFFEQPTQIFSNILNGYGVFGGAATKDIYLKFP